MFIADGCASGMLYLLMSLVVVTVMHVLSMLSLVLVPVASKEGTVSSQLVVARKGLKKATGANPSNLLFPLNVVLRNATTIRQVQCTSQE